MTDETRANIQAVICIAIPFVVIIGIICIMAHFTDSYPIRGVCKDKTYTSDKTGDAHYHILIQYEDGTGTEMDVSAGSYISYNVGITYWFHKDTLSWNPPKR